MIQYKMLMNLVGAKLYTQSAYNYTIIICTFSALKSPLVTEVIDMLVNYPDFIWFKDVIDTMPQEDKR